MAPQQRPHAATSSRMPKGLARYRRRPPRAPRRVHLLGTSGEHQHRDGRGLAQAAQHLQAVEPRSIQSAPRDPAGPRRQSARRRGRPPRSAPGNAASSSRITSRRSFRLVFYQQDVGHFPHHTRSTRILPCIVGGQYGLGVRGHPATELRQNQTARRRSGRDYKCRAIGAGSPLRRPDPRREQYDATVTISHRGGVTSLGWSAARPGRRAAGEQRAGARPGPAAPSDRGPTRGPAAVGGGPWRWGGFALPAQLSGLRDVPAASASDHFKGVQVNLADKDGQPLVVTLTPGTATAASATSLTVAATTARPAPFPGCRDGVSAAARPGRPQASQSSIRPGRQAGRGNGQRQRHRRGRLGGQPGAWAGRPLPLSRLPDPRAAALARTLQAAPAAPCDRQVAPAPR